jgi:hypothetical protein
MPGKNFRPPIASKADSDSVNATDVKRPWLFNTSMKDELISASEH